MKTLATLSAAALSVTLAAPAFAAPPVPALKPGMWSITTTIDNVQMSGPMAGVGAVLKGKTTTVQHCLTQDEVNRGPADMLNARKGCTYAKQSYSGGHISIEATCPHGQTTSQLAEDGEYNPSGFHTKARAVETGGSMPMTMDMTLVGTRTGDCAGK